MNQSQPVQLTREWIAHQFDMKLRDSLGRKRVSLNYRISIVVVAFFMALLPLIYVALIGAVIYGAYYHATHNTWLIEDRNGKLSRLMFVYIVPLLLSPFLVLFMIKPLFAKPIKQRPSETLSPKDAPLLFALLEHLSSAIGAPMPTRIDINCDINASASFRRGLKSFFDNDLVLTIGLPLVAALQLRQFVGVLAHELGHFSQGTGMRLSHVIRSISFWFARVVYEQDSWDDWLAKIILHLDFKMGILLWIAGWMIWFTRCVLWLLMMIGHMVSCILLREMEFDADRYEIQIAGSQTFDSTFQQLRLLEFAAHGTYADMDEFYREGKLADNIPRYIAELIPQIPADFRQKLNDQLQFVETDLLSTHPTDRDRIARARRNFQPGAFQIEAPASVIFEDFDSLCQQSTFLLYRDSFGDEFSANSVRPYEELVEQSNYMFETRRSLQSYMLECYSPLRLLQIPNSLSVDCTQPEQALEVITSSRSTMLSQRERYLDTHNNFETFYVRLLELSQFVALHRAGLHPQPNLFSMRFDINLAPQIDSDLKSKIRTFEEGLSKFEMAVGVRLFAALRLLQTPQAAPWFEDVGQTIAACRDSYYLLKTLNENHYLILEIRSEVAMLSILSNYLQLREKDKLFAGEIKARLAKLHGGITELLKRTEAIPYPFDHAEASVSVAQYLLKSIPDQDDLPKLGQAASKLLDNWLLLYNRLSAQLIHVSEHIEDGFGLKPLSETLRFA